MLIEAMRTNAGTRLLYGVLPLPGTVGQLAQWEIGTYLVVCTGLMAVLLTCRTLRADEDEGLVELLRGAGAGRWTPLLAPLGVVAGIVALHAAGVGVIMTALTGSVEELTVRGAWALAGVVAVVGWALMGVSAVACQLARDAGGARGASLGALGVAFALRAAADDADAPWLRWLSPIAWRDLVEPYTADRPAPLVVAVVVCLALAAAAGALYAHREYLDGYLPDRSASRRRWRVRGYADLLARLVRRPLAAWAVAAACVSALFGTMAGSITDLLEPGSPTAQMVDKMADGSPVSQFMGLLTVFTVLLVVVAAAAGALYAHREYLDGYLPDRSASRRRWRVRGYADLLARLVRRPLAAWAVAAACVSALFGTMAGSITDLLEPGSPTAQMVDKMADGSPVSQFMGLLTVFTVLLVVVAAVGRAGALAGDERRGLVEAEAAAGASRTRLFVVQAGAAVIEAAILLLISGGVLAAATAGQTTRDHAVARALVYTVSQLPGALAAIGLALALVGLAPRRWPLVWAVVAWSAFARFLGGLVELPDWARDMSVIGHYLDVTGPVDWKPLAVQGAVGLAGAVVGLLAYRRRDLGA